MTFHSTLPASTAPAIRPAWRPNSRAVAKAVNSTPRNPVSAGHRRAVQWCSPNIVKAVAVAQYCSAGFSKYLMPLRRGVSQSPLATISRGISE